MPQIRRTFFVSAAPEAVYDYLADFSHAEEWDPGTKECERLDGDGEVGTRYRNVSEFLGRTTEVTYTTREATRPSQLHFEGRAPGFEGHDRLSFEPSGPGTSVTYQAQMRFSGAAKLATPLVSLYLPSLAKKTVATMQETLDRL